MCDKRRKNPLKNVTNLLNKILCNLFSVLLFFTKKDPIFDFFTPFYAPKMWITMWICGLSPLFTDILTMWLFEKCFLKISCQGKIINKILSHFYLKFFLTRAKKGAKNFFERGDYTILCKPLPTKNCHRSKTLTIFTPCLFA